MDNAGFGGHRDHSVITVVRPGKWLRVVSCPPASGQRAVLPAHCADVPRAQGFMPPFFSAFATRLPGCCIRETLLLHPCEGSLLYQHALPILRSRNKTSMLAYC